MVAIFDRFPNPEGVNLQNEVLLPNPEGVGQGPTGLYEWVKFSPKEKTLVRNEVSNLGLDKLRLYTLSGLVYLLLFVKIFTLPRIIKLDNLLYKKQVLEENDF